MPQIQLDDEVFNAARRRAAEEGYGSVDEYIADVVTHDLVEEGAADSADQTPNLDHLFTPERIAELERISAEIEAGGKTYTMDEVREHLKRTREQWLAKHGS